MKGINNLEKRGQCILEVFLIFLLGLFALSAPFGFAGLFGKGQQGMAYFVTLLISVSALVFGCITWVRIEEKLSNTVKKPFSAKAWLYICVAALGANYVIGTLTALVTFFGYNLQDTYSASSIETNVPALILQVAILSPLLEEYVFRGIILHR